MRAVRQFRRAEWPEKPFLRKLDVKMALVAADRQPGAGKGVLGRRVERGRVPGLADGLQRGGQIAAVVGQDWSSRAELGLPGGRFGVGAKVIVEGKWARDPARRAEVTQPGVSTPGPGPQTAFPSPVGPAPRRELSNRRNLSALWGVGDGGALSPWG